MKKTHITIAIITLLIGLGASAFARRPRPACGDEKLANQLSCIYDMADLQEEREELDRIYQDNLTDIERRAESLASQSGYGRDRISQLAKEVRLGLPKTK